MCDMDFLSTDPDNYLLLTADTYEITNNKLLSFCPGTPEVERGSDVVSKDDLMN